MTGGNHQQTMERASAPHTETDATGGADPYAAATAEFYDLLATAHWREFGPQLGELLASVDATNGPIIDVGAGTGVGLPYLLEAVPGASILAIEPSKAMRTALHTRLALCDDLRTVTTVDPRPLADAALPDQASAIVVSAAFGHLTDAERRRLWAVVGECLPAGAPAVVEVLPPHRPVVVPPTQYRALPVGGFVYEGWQQGEPADDRTMRWTMTYRVMSGSDVVAEHQVTSNWRCCSVDDVRDEVAPFGLDVVDHGESVVVSRPAQSA